MINDGFDAVYAYGSNDAAPIDWESEPYTFWNLVCDCGENYVRSHPDVIVDAMEVYHFFRNAKSTERAATNKFWSLPFEERIGILYDYFNENIDYWQNELEKENKQ